MVIDGICSACRSTKESLPTLSRIISGAGSGGKELLKETQVPRLLPEQLRHNLPTAAG